MGAPTYGKRDASPGVFGALKDAVQSVINATAPRSVTDIKARNDQNEADALGERRARQHNSDNN